MGVNYDFSGYVTKNNIRCSDGRTIRQNAFIECDGKTVPMVWQHQHNDPMNVLGHVLLENREDGVYGYGVFNDTEVGKHAKEMVKHGDINAMSIYANKLKQHGGDVLHGVIREVSLVLAGANPGALIEFPIIAHSGEEAEDQAIIYTDELLHAESGDMESEEEGKERTIKDVFDEFTEEQKNVVYFMIGQALEDAGKSEDAPETNKEETDDSVSHADEEIDKGEENMANEKTVKDVFDELTEEQKNVVYFMIGQALEDAGASGEGEDMKHNVFDNEYEYGPALSHSDIQDIFADAKRCGSLRDAVMNFCDGNEELAHAITDDEGNTVNYGIANINYLFPDAQAVNKTPDFIKRPDDWVSVVMNGVHHTPFSRIKSVYADITMEDARAKGYIKGNRKSEEVFSLLKRTTSPTTVYKKQKLDRDDVIDITDFDVVSWLKAEMRMMLDEEIARAILIGDGRSSASDDKINELNIRPIWTDDSLYTISKKLNFAENATEDDQAKAVIKAAVKARKDYKGSGNPVFFTTEDWLTNMLLLEDSIGHRLYKTEQELATAMRVSKIVTVPVMENKSRVVSGVTYGLIGLIVNLNDYNVGADKGGAVNMFDDFDIDYNAQKYLIETRCSGAMIKPYAAIAIEANFQ